jgi:hypothetical protein
MRLTQRWDDGDGYVYRAEGGSEPAFAIDPTAFQDRVCTTSNVETRKAQERWVAAALAASGYLLSGTDGPTRSMRLADGTRARLYVLQNIAGPVNLALTARGLRNEARARDDVQPYPHGPGGRIITPPPRIRPWEWTIRLDYPEDGPTPWYVSILSV